MSTRIALATDIHVGYDRDGLAAAAQHRFDQLIAAINAAQADFIIFGGDLVENADSEEMRRFIECARQFDAPHRAIPGNHDVGNRKLPGKEGDEMEVNAERIALFEECFGSSFWREEVKGAVRIIGVNASLFGSGLEREEEQWQWLAAQLNEPDALPTLLATHYPLYLETPDENGTADWNAGLPKDYWTIEPQSRRRLFGFLAHGNVRAVLSGHLHHPLRHEHAGVLLLSSVPVAFALPRAKPPGERSWPGWTLITIGENGEVETEWQRLESEQST